MTILLINDKELFSRASIDGKDSLRRAIKNFCNYTYDEINLDAIFDIERWLKRLLEFEIFLSLTKKRHRDHLKHACRIALLGDKLLKEELIIDGKKLRLLDLIRELLLMNPQARGIFESYNVNINDKELLNQKILQIWFVAAIFHDIGFIYEAFVESWKNIQFLNDYPNFKDFLLDIEGSIYKFQKEFFISSIHNKYIACDFARGFDHGKIGACLISNLLGESNLICDMAAVIADRHTSKEEITFVDNPLSFLMIILDEVQEWERPVIGKKMEDQALSEEISNYLGYGESISDTPELNEIMIRYEAKMISSSKISLMLDFILNYGNKRDLLDKTSFSFPLMMYLKYKNIQRLRIEKINNTYITCRDLPETKNKCKQKIMKSNLDNAFKELGYSDIGDLNISLNIKSSGDLADKWHRQCDILLFKSLVDRNNVISDWLCNVVDYRENKGKVKFELDKNKYLPLIFDGDYREIILNSHEQYLRDLYISKEDWNAIYTYNRTKDPNIVEYIINIKRKIKRCEKDIPIHGVFAAFDADAIDYPVAKVKIDGSDVTEKIRMVLIPPRKNDSGHKYEERILLHIPLEPPITTNKAKIIDYTVRMRVSLNQLIKKRPNYDGLLNNRKLRTLQGKITVLWDKNLFDQLYKYGILFCGSDEGCYKLFQCIADDRAFSKCKAYRGLLTANEKGMYYRFDTGPEILDQNHEMGFIWLDKEI